MKSPGPIAMHSKYACPKFLKDKYKKERNGEGEKEAQSNACQLNWGLYS